MKINQIGLSRLHNDTHFQFHTEFKDLAGKYNILQDLEGKYASNVAKVGLGPWLAELKARNIAFSDLMRERFDESSLKVDIVLKKARVQLDEAYYAITELINALVLVEGAANYEGFIKKLNPIISKYVIALAAKAGRVSKRKGKGKSSAAGGSHE